MGKKIIVVITILLIVGLFTGWYLFTRESKYLGTSAFMAIPANTPVVIRIHHLKDYTSRSLKNQIWKTTSAFPGVASLYDKLRFADSLFSQYPNPDNPFKNKELTIALQERNNQLHWLSLIELSSLSEKSELADLIEKYIRRKGASAQVIKTGKAELHEYMWKTGETKNHYYSTFFRGLFLGCDDRIVLEEAVSHLENPATAGIPAFEKANKSKADNVDAQIYVNHKTTPQFFRELFSTPFIERLQGSAPPAIWSEIDLTQKADELILNGFSYTSDSLNTQLGIFLHQKPDSLRLVHLFPAETSFFLGYVINDNPRFFSDYERLLTSNHTFDKYRQSLNEIDTTYGINLQKLILDHLDGSAAIAFTRPDPTMIQENKYLFIRVNSGSQTEEAMFPLALTIPGHKKKEKPKNYTIYQIDKETEFKIYQTPVTDFGKRVFGELFADVATGYYTFYDNCLIMGSSFESLGRVLRSNILHETLANDHTFRQFTSGLSDRLNIYLWSSPGRALPFFKEILSSNTYKNSEKNHQALLKIESFGWQIGNENGMIYNMARLKYNPEVHESPASLLWRSQVGGPLMTGPQLLTSTSGNNQSAIVLQDEEFNITFVSPDGRIISKTKLKGPIKSGITRVEGSSESHTRYVFGTTETLEMINQEGNNEPHFPVKLPSAATNGVTVCDYEQNNDYRFFIACKDHKVYLYDKKGKLVTGWVPSKSEHDVVNPVQFFRIGNKDHLVYTDKNRIYLLDRKGKPIVTVRGDFTFSNNGFTLIPKSGKTAARIVTTDANGTILSIGFDGTVKKVTVDKFSAAHHFVCLNSGMGNVPNYLFLDGDSLVAYNLNGGKLFTRKFNHPIGTPPQLFTFPDKTLRIGITDAVENKIYLLNSDGTVCEGFPLEGSTPFALSFPSGQNGPFNLFTGTADGYLNKYGVK